MQAWFKGDLRASALSSAYLFFFSCFSRIVYYLWHYNSVRWCSLTRGLDLFSTVFFFLSSRQVAGGGEGSQGQIEIFSLNRPMPRAVKSLQVGAAVRCLEYVPEPSPSEEEEAGGHRAPSGIGANICVGSDDGRWATDITESRGELQTRLFAETEWCKNCEIRSNRQVFRCEQNACLP